MTVTKFTNTLLAIALVALGLACGPTGNKPDGGADGGAKGDSCIDDSDCPDAKLFFCNTTTSMCEPSCRQKADCTAAVRGQYALTECAGALGCECDEGKCAGSLCSADEDCGATQVCRSGSCVAPVASSGVTKCSITPDFVIAREGATVKYWVSAWDANNKPIIVKEGATWTAAGTNFTATGTGNSITATATTATAGTMAANSVQAAFGSVNCTAKAIVLGAPTAGKIGVVVTDELSGRPIADTKVLTHDPAALATAADAAALDTQTTDARGYAELTTAATVTVSAFKATHAYATVANYTAGTTSADRNLIHIAVRRNQVDNYGGYKGGFDNVPMTSNVHAAIAGMSLPGSITNLSLTTLLGPSVPTDIKIGSAINETGVGIPSGVFLGFTDQKIKNTISGQGLASTCADEAKVLAGTCGTSTAWALAGDVPLGDLPIDAVASGLDNINIGALLGRIIPIFKKFNSSIVRDVTYELKSSTGTDGGVDISTTDFFTNQNHNFTQVPLAFSFVVKLPELPKYKGQYADGALLIGGAEVPGRGVVPLGLGVGANTTVPKDAFTDKQLDLPAAGLVQMRMAPTHDGIEGSPYGLLIASISTAGLTDVSARVGASAIFPRVATNKLAFDPKGTTPLDVSGNAFPLFPEGANYNFTNAAIPGLGGRQFKISGSLTGLGVLKVMFTDAREHRWEVYADATTAAAGFVVPTPPAGTTDRTFTNGMTTGGRSAFSVQALQLKSAGTEVGFNKLIEANSTNLDRLTALMTAFSFLDYGKPSVSISTPSTNPATIAKGANIEVKVNNFKIGTTAADDGVVVVSFSLNGQEVSGCPNVTLSAETTAGNGKLSAPLNMTCMGTAMTMKATLVRPDLVPLAPAVAATTIVTVQ